MFNLKVVCLAFGFVISFSVLRLAASDGASMITDDDARPAATLYDQTDDASGSGIVVLDFESDDDEYDCDAADDFTVPAGGWWIERVELLGSYWDGGGSAEGVNLWFFRDQSGWPGGAAVCSYSEVVPTSDGAGLLTPGMIVVDLPTDCVLSPGAHWLAAQIRMEPSAGGRFYWSLRTAQSGNESVWRNPGDGFNIGATTWTRMTATDPGSIERDLNFLLAGGEGAPLIFTDGFESGNYSAWTAKVP